MNGDFNQWVNLKSRKDQLVQAIFVSATKLEGILQIIVYKLLLTEQFLSVMVPSWSMTWKKRERECEICFKIGISHVDEKINNSRLR